MSTRLTIEETFLKGKEIVERHCQLLKQMAVEVNNAKEDYQSLRFPALSDQHCQATCNMQDSFTQTSPRDTSLGTRRRKRGSKSISLAESPSYGLNNLFLSQRSTFGQISTPTPSEVAEHSLMSDATSSTSGEEEICRDATVSDAAQQILLDWTDFHQDEESVRAGKYPRLSFTPPCQASKLHGLETSTIGMPNQCSSWLSGFREPETPPDPESTPPLSEYHTGTPRVSESEASGIFPAESPSFCQNSLFLSQRSSFGQISTPTPSEVAEHSFLSGAISRASGEEEICHDATVSDTAQQILSDWTDLVMDEESVKAGNYPKLSFTPPCQASKLHSMKTSTTSSTGMPNHCSSWLSGFREPKTPPDLESTPPLRKYHPGTLRASGPEVIRMALSLGEFEDFPAQIGEIVPLQTSGTFLIRHRRRKDSKVSAVVQMSSLLDTPHDELDVAEVRKGSDHQAATMLDVAESPEPSKVKGNPDANSLVGESDSNIRLEVNAESPFTIFPTTSSVPESDLNKTYVVSGASSPRSEDAQMEHGPSGQRESKPNLGRKSRVLSFQEFSDSEGCQIHIPHQHLALDANSSTAGNSLEEEIWMDKSSNYSAIRLMTIRNPLSSR